MNDDPPVTLAVLLTVIIGAGIFIAALLAWALDRKAYLP